MAEGKNNAAIAAVARSHRALRREGDPLDLPQARARLGDRMHKRVKAVCSTSPRADRILTAERDRAGRSACRGRARSRPRATAERADAVGHVHEAWPCRGSPGRSPTPSSATSNRRRPRAPATRTVDCGAVAGVLARRSAAPRGSRSRRRPRPRRVAADAVAPRRAAAAARRRAAARSASASPRSISSGG